VTVANSSARSIDGHRHNRVVNLTWNPVGAATGYNVKRSNGGRPISSATNALSGVNYADRAVTNASLTITWFRQLHEWRKRGFGASQRHAHARFKPGFEKTRVSDINIIRLGLSGRSVYY